MFALLVKLCPLLGKDSNCMWGLNLNKLWCCFCWRHEQNTHNSLIMTVKMQVILILDVFLGPSIFCQQLSPKIHQLAVRAPPCWWLCIDLDLGRRCHWKLSWLLFFFFILKSKTGSSALFSLCGLFFSHMMQSHVIVDVLLITDVCSNLTLELSFYAKTENSDNVFQLVLNSGVSW